MQCDAPRCTKPAQHQLCIDAQPLARICSEQCSDALLEAIGMPRRPYNPDDDEDIQAVKRIPPATGPPPSDETRARMMSLLPLARKPAPAPARFALTPTPMPASSSSSSVPPMVPPLTSSAPPKVPPLTSSRVPPLTSSSSSSSAAASSSSAPPIVPPLTSSSSSSRAAASSSSAPPVVPPLTSAPASAATVAPLPPAAAAAPPAADERDPVPRTLVQIYGITPAMAATLGFTVYRLLDADNDEAAMRALLAPAFDDGDMHDLLARAPIKRNDELDQVVQHALSWVRINRDRIARWRAATGRALPDLTRPSGWLQDVPGLNPKLISAPDNARRFGIGTLRDLQAYYRRYGAASARRQLMTAGYTHGKQKVDLDAALAYVASLP